MLQEFVRGHRTFAFCGALALATHLWRAKRLLQWQAIAELGRHRERCTHHQKASFLEICVIAVEGAMSKSHVVSDAVSIRLGTTDAALRNNRRAY